MAVDTIYQKVKLQNRPFSLNDILNNLHNEFGKSSVQKALERLVRDGKVFEKVYGKQKVYCTVQDSKCDAEELMRIDKQLQVHLNELETKQREVEKEVRVHEATLSSIKSSVTLEEALNECEALKISTAQLSQKIDGLIEATGAQDLTKLKRKADDKLKEYTAEYLKRKRLCTDILDCILENYPSNKKDLYEEIGIEVKTVQ